MAEQTVAELRLYVGGLGEKVTEQDIKNTFNNLGVVQSVDLIRTKGRSFAYINFIPSSTNSLAKLFSTYNGCSWKGGKLKLEKAKEHYLDRLKREWAEEEELKNSEHINHGDVDATTIELPKPPSKLDLENMEFRLFFPKLRKLKPLPLTGTGKHKYSFRRLEAPPIPVHFCDCPEHAVPVQTRAATRAIAIDGKKGGINKKEYNRPNPVMNRFLHRETSSDHREIANHDSVIQDDGMNEEEINMIDSVMKKLLARGTSSKRDQENLQFSKQKTVTSEIEEVTNNDDDDIKIDAVSVQNCSPFSRGLERRESLSNEETNDIEDETDDDDDDIQINVVSRRNVRQTRSANEITRLNERTESLNRKRKSVSIETNANDTKSPIHEKKSLLNIPLKKSPWKQLVGDGSNSSFTLSQITSEKDINQENQPKLGNKEPKPSKKATAGSEEPEWDNHTKSNVVRKVAPEEPKPREEVTAGSEKHEDDNNYVQRENQSSQHNRKRKKANKVGPEETKPSNEAPADTLEHKEDNNSVQIDSQLPQNNKKNKKGQTVVPKETKPNDELPTGIEELDMDPPAGQRTGDSDKVTQGISWLQRSSWIDLVGGGTNSSFSISQILPEDLVQKHNSHKADDFNTVSFTSTGAFSKEQGTSEMTSNDSRSFKPSLDGSSPKMEIRDSIPKPASSYLARGVEISESCPFMRNADSVKEWMTAKTSMSKSLRKMKNK